MLEITENEMIYAFLVAEFESSRFSAALSSALNGIHANLSIIHHPDFNSDSENLQRKQILSMYRGYPDKLLFEGFPKDVKWYKKQLSASEFLDIKYTSYSYWVELSNKTRSPTVAAENIRKGVRAFDQSNTHYIEMEKELEKTKRFPTIICIADSFEPTELVVLEGHSRLTVYAMRPDLIPEKQEVIIGMSDSMKDYDLYS